MINNSSIDSNAITCNCLKLRRAAQAITKTYDDYLKPSNLKVGQFSMLKTISLHAPVNTSELADKLRLDRTTLVRNLKLLEDRELVTDISKKGSRDRQLILTDAGKESLKLAEGLWQKAQQFIEDYLGSKDLQVLQELLERVEKI